MERQRCFSVKPTRLLVFSFIISASLLLLSIFSIWLFIDDPSIAQETHIKLNTTSLVPGLESKVKKSFLLDAHFGKSNDSTGNAMVSVIEKVENKDYGFTVAKGRNSTEAGKGCLASKQHRNSDLTSEKTEVSDAHQRIEATRSESNVKKSFLLDAHFGKSNDSTRNAMVSVTEKVENKDNGFTVAKGRNSTDAGKGYLAREQHRNSDHSPEKTEVSDAHQRIEATRSECDVTNGKWVFDGNYPLYTNSSCPFIDEGFNCQANGRWDRDYMKWRWKPHECNIPRLDAVKMLKLIRGKRLVFVGDSINRNQWESMLCLLRAAVTDPKRVYETHGRRITKEKGYYSFKFVDYKCTVEYYVTHFLVHESKARVGRKRTQTLQIDTVDKGSSRWRGADILVFNTGHWWNHYKTKAGVNYYQEEKQVHPYLDASTAFRRALMTWASWVDKQINPSKTQVFFQSSVPSHFRGGQWNSGGHCGEAIRPLNDTSHVNYPERNIILEEVIQKMKTPVTLLNVTSLSEYRIDGHPSVYGRKTVDRTPSRVQDCSHWCLPGVPDIWNELLYFYLQSKQKSSSP
ncbi:hypothetical protein NE237_015612 [Protea cynaroides]|uniref:Trichome birefringence-like N-terminal domain-containing protein n=1 Tax=Protea cynaroides TaxID=273540 RepID=A0A9Q0KEM7_9MAGN|nr:hypothetical protein NE237_015612 [Protea cynaroides]